MADLASTAKSYVDGSRSRWEQLVDLTLGLQPRQLENAARRLGELAGEKPQTVLRKMKAIRYCYQAKLTAQDIKVAGQGGIIGKYVMGKTKERTLPLVSFPHRLTKPVRDDLHELVLRLGNLLRLKTYDEVFEFIIAQFTVSDEEILHAAGEGNAQKPRQTVRTIPAHSQRTPSAS